MGLKMKIFSVTLAVRLLNILRFCTNRRRERGVRVGESAYTTVHKLTHTLQKGSVSWREKYICSVRGLH